MFSYIFGCYTIPIVQKIRIKSVFLCVGIKKGTRAYWVFPISFFVKKLISKKKKEKDEKENKTEEGRGGWVGKGITACMLKEMFLQTNIREQIHNRPFERAFVMVQDCNSSIRTIKNKKKRKY